MLLFADDLPHDCNVLECLGEISAEPRGTDFGRDGIPDTPDDLRLVDAVAALAAADVPLVVLESSGGEIDYNELNEMRPFEAIWRCLAESTGGAVGVLQSDGTTPDGSPLADVVGPIVRDAVARCGSLTLAAAPPYDAWLASAGVEHLDVRLPAVREWDIRLCIPPGTPDGTHDFEVRMLCDGEPVASQSVHVVVGGDCLAPVMGPVAARDVSPCTTGIELTWPAATFRGPTGSGVYNVYRSAVSCADALLRPAIATGLTLPRHVDLGSTGGGATWHYVVEAEDATATGPCAPAGAHHGGVAARACVTPAVRDDGTGPFPDVVGAVLRVAHRGEEITVSWTDARTLVGREHFHLLKAIDDPTAPFARVNPENDLSRRFTETDSSGTLQFFDVRVANECEEMSIDEFPPGYDR